MTQKDSGLSGLVSNSNILWWLFTWFLFFQTKVGIPMNIIAILVLTLAINTWGKAIFDLDNIPSFFPSVLNTSVCEDIVPKTMAPNLTTIAANATTMALGLTTTVPLTTPW